MSHPLTLIHGLDADPDDSPPSGGVASGAPYRSEEGSWDDDRRHEVSDRPVAPRGDDEFVCAACFTIRPLHQRVGTHCIDCGNDIHPAKPRISAPAERVSHHLCTACLAVFVPWDVLYCLPCSLIRETARPPHTALGRKHRTGSLIAA